MEEKINTQDDEFYHKGLQALKKGNYDYAAELLSIVLQSNPEFTQCRHHLLRAARESQKSKNLSLSARSIISLNTFFLSLKAAYFYIQNRFDSAVNIQERIVLSNPGNTSALYRLADLFHKTHKLNDAVVVLEEILLIDKSNISALKLLARLYFQTQNYAKAKTAASMLLGISPNNFEAENIIKDISALGTIEKGFDEIKPAT